MLTKIKKRKNNNYWFLFLLHRLLGTSLFPVDRTLFASDL